MRLIGGSLSDSIVRLAVNGTDPCLATNSPTLTLPVLLSLTVVFGMNAKYDTLIVQVAKNRP